MQRLQWSVVVLLFVSASGFGQGKRDPGKLVRDLDELNLNEEQKKKVHKIRQRFLDKHKDTIKSLREETRQVRQSMESARNRQDVQAMRDAKKKLAALRGKAEDLVAELDKNLSKVLDDAQRKRWQEIRQRHKP